MIRFENLLFLVKKEKISLFLSKNSREWKQNFPQKNTPYITPNFPNFRKNTAKITPKFGKIWGQENPRLCLGPKRVWGQFSLMLVLYTPLKIFYAFSFIFLLSCFKGILKHF